MGKIKEFIEHVRNIDAMLTKQVEVLEYISSHLRTLADGQSYTAPPLRTIADELRDIEEHQDGIVFHLRDYVNHALGRKPKEENLIVGAAAIRKMLEDDEQGGRPKPQAPSPKPQAPSPKPIKEEDTVKKAPRKKKNKGPRTVASVARTIAANTGEDAKKVALRLKQIYPTIHGNPAKRGRRMTEPTWRKAIQEQVKNFKQPRLL